MGAMKFTYGELVKAIISEMVDRPDLVDVEEKDLEHLTEVNVEVDKQDAGKIIGKNGKKWRAIQEIVGAISAQRKRQCRLNCNV